VGDAVLEGGCFCGAIRYQLHGGLQPAQACHCSRCRKAFSGPSSAYAALPEGSSLSWLSGAELLTRYAGASGWGLAFCRVCGSTLCGILNGTVHGLILGSVDGDPGVDIARHLFTGSKAAWDHIGGDAPQYDEWPTGDDEERAD